MPREASVAPKERVNIVYRPATGDAQEEIELPLKLLVMGDFTLRPDDTPLDERKPINVDKDNFNEVLAAQNLELNLTVTNKLVEDPEAQMAVHLRFKSLKDFEPESIVNQVPELKKLLELREALQSLKAPISNIPQFRKKIQELIQDENLRKRVLEELGLEEK